MAESPSAAAALLRRLVIHDLSKFSRAEWGPYVRRFVGGRAGLMDKSADPAVVGQNCTCAGPLVNTNVDGNEGHSPGCPARPSHPSAA